MTAMPKTKTTGKAHPWSLPIPLFYEVKEMLSEIDVMTFVALDPMAGRRHRYSVIRIERASGKTYCVGRELPLKLARKVARHLYLHGEEK